MNYWGKNSNAPPMGLPGQGCSPIEANVVSVQKPQPKHNFPTYTPPDSLLSKPKRKKKPLPDISPAEPEPKPFVPYTKPKTDAPVKRGDPKQDFLKAFKKLTYRFGTWEVWSDFVTIVACTLSNPLDRSHYEEREALYLKSINKYNKDERDLFPELFAQTVLALEDNPEQDFLGELFLTLNLENKHRGQVFTPYHIGRFMASIICGDVAAHVERKGYITLNDSCCGAGVLMIAGIHEAKRQLEEAGLNWQNHVLVVAQDIDRTVALMCYIQLSLLGVAGYVKVGCALSEPIVSNDSTENYWFTPMYFSDVWTWRRFLRGGMQHLFEKPVGDDEKTDPLQANLKGEHRNELLGKET